MPIKIKAPYWYMCIANLWHCGKCNKVRNTLRSIQKHYKEAHKQ